MSASQVEDLRLAASKMYGTERRSFQAEMALKYCQGNARWAERLFGWGRVNVKVGLAEARTGIICVGAQSGYSGAKCWEEKYLAWARSMTWKGVHPIVKLNSKSYLTGISLTKAAMRDVERRLQRHPNLPKWDILIQTLPG